MSLALLLACRPEQGLRAFEIDAPAAVAGDFDRLEAVLADRQVQADVYEGYIVGPADGEARADARQPLATVEDLLDQGLLAGHDALFLNSGVRGLGATVYNGDAPDDGIVGDPERREALVAWVEAGGVLVLSDWALDLVRVGWPELFVFSRAEAGVDGAQVGVSARVRARVEEPEIAATLGAEEVELLFPFTWWTVVEGADPSVEILLTGAAERWSEADPALPVEDAILLARAPVGRGRVVLSAFSWAAQPPDLARRLLGLSVEGLP